MKVSTLFGILQNEVYHGIEAELDEIDIFFLDPDEGTLIDIKPEDISMDVLKGGVTIIQIAPRYENRVRQ